ncbi:MAG: hypothetical protein H6R24_443 [Proteobacteria bacterium]|nr:hypothetical protein [Pseudomonadota bacterium]
MTDQSDEQQDETITDPVSEEAVEQERREFLRSLSKWSQAVIVGVVAGGALTTSEPAEAWYNRGGNWYNRRPLGGWYNRGGGWYNRGGGWHNRGGGWYNRGGGYRRVPGWDDRS